MRLKWWTLAAVLLAGVRAAGAEGAGTHVGIDSGPVIGKFELNTSVRAFLGIPFAAPPVGEARWKEPQPVAAWQRLLRAQRNSSVFERSGHRFA